MFDKFLPRSSKIPLLGTGHAETATYRNWQPEGNRSVPLLKSPLPQRERVGERGQSGRGD
jgi:hypothetical protein